VKVVIGLKLQTAQLSTYKKKLADSQFEKGELLREKNELTENLKQSQLECQQQNEDWKNHLANEKEQITMYFVREVGEAGENLLKLIEDQAATMES
jgi:hypothetical protein